MPAYHFEGSCDSGFQISGVLEAEDESHARRKAQRFCATSELMLVSEIEPTRQDIRPGVAVPLGGATRGGEGRKMSLAATVVAALLGRRPPRDG